MTTVSLGFTRGIDQVGKKGEPASSTRPPTGSTASALTQILTPRWLVSANFEAISDDGFLGSPYRVARVFGAAVPERIPAHPHQPGAVKFRAIGDLGDAQRGARRVPLLLGHLGHQGAHLRGRLQPLLRRATGWPTPSCASTRRTRRCSTATTPQPRPPTSRATASSAPSTASAWAPSWPTRAPTVPGQYELEAQRRVRVACASSYSDFTDCAPASPTVQRQRAAAVGVGHVLKGPGAMILQCIRVFIAAAAARRGSLPGRRPAPTRQPRRLAARGRRRRRLRRRLHAPAAPRPRLPRRRRRRGAGKPPRWTRASRTSRPTSSA